MEQPVQFICNNNLLHGILHIPDNNTNPSTIVIILTGGPQVRTGAHRLFVHLSRYLSEYDIPSLRFDYEGLGDSEGDFMGYQHAGPSINAAIRYLQGIFYDNLSFIIWSLCDGATAAILYNSKNPEHIKGLILCNPFVITEGGLARTTIKKYYRQRFFESQFIYKLFRGDVDIKKSLLSLWNNIKGSDLLNTDKNLNSENHINSLPFIVINSIREFSNPIKIILSTNDIVASNFKDELNKYKSIKLKSSQKKITLYDIEGADHTFTDPIAKELLFSTILSAINDIESELSS